MIEDNNPLSDSKDSKIAPPQPPARTNVKTTLQYQQQQSTDASDQNVLGINVQNSVAADVAAKLVHKSAQLGSVPNIGQNSGDPSEHSASSKTNTTDSIVSQKQIDSIRNAIETDQISTPNQSSQNKPPTKPPQPQINFNQHPLITTNSSINASYENSIHLKLPWILLHGEYLVSKNQKDQNDLIYSEIIFVMPDNRGIRGKLYVTNFRLYFKSDEVYSLNYYSNCVSNESKNVIIDLPLGLINRIEKIGHQSSKQMNFYGLLITCKNGRRLRFANMPQCEKGERKQLYDIIHRYSFPLSNGLNFFAFDFFENLRKQSTLNNQDASFIKQDSVYDIKLEFERMGIFKSKDWRFSEININYKFCDTYPKILVVPSSVTDDDLRHVGDFRSKHRIPVVSWLRYDNRKNNVALLRSSQPLVGLPPQKRSEKDENYLYTLYKMNTINSTNSLFIMDARPLVNAVANRTTGGGYENQDYYKNCELVFLNIHNIHVMRESLRKIFDMATNLSITNASSNTNHNNNSAVSSNLNQQQQQQQQGVNLNKLNQNLTANATNSSTTNSAQVSAASSDDKNFLINLENSKWLEHIRSVLNGALKVVKHINGENSTVLVHCSDGWDRTAQLTSLAMLMMDKYYRTLRGFQVLVEKEWLSFGHRFGTRMGHGTDKHSDQDRSPIFLQFIDCVWQLLQQNSKVFEFNEKFLLTIVNNMYTCQFGTFLYNNENEREKHDCRNKTFSLWSYINLYKNEFKNPNYVEFDGVVECSTNLASLQLWINYYFQYKEVVDDSANDSTVNSINLNQLKQNQSQLPSTNSASSFLITPPMSSSKLLGQTFFSHMVQSMKASVRNLNTTSGSNQINLVSQSGATPSQTGQSNFNSTASITNSNYFIQNNFLNQNNSANQDPELVRYKALVAPASADIY